MPDTRSVMKEFRSLEAKRAAGGLTPAEEVRYAHLRDLVGLEPAPRPGFDVDAAAAQLRESLLPAGLRNRPPPTAPPIAPEPAVEEPSAADAFASAYAAEPSQQVEEAQPPDALFDPASLSPDAVQPPYDPAAANEPTQPGWDPNAPYDPNAQYGAAQGDDPNAPWDPNASADANAPDAAAQGWDPAAQPYDANAQPYDPNAQPYDPSAQPYDPNALPYDPSAQAYDPNAPPYDPAAQASADAAPLDPDAQPWDAAPPQDAGAETPSWDAAAAYDADAPLDAAALAYDPNASPDAGAQAYPAPDAKAAGEVDPLAEPASPGEGFLSDPAALPPEGWIAPDAGPSPQPGAEPTPSGEDPALEALLPFDAAAAAAIAPGEVPDGFGQELGEYDDTAGFQNRYGDAAPADLPRDDPEFQATQSVEPEATEGWQPDVVLDDGFQLESGGSFDAAAEAAAPEWAGGAAAPPWDTTPASVDVSSGAFTAPSAEPLPEDAFAGAGAAPADVPAVADLAPLDADVADAAGAGEASPLPTDDFSVDVDVTAEAAPATAETELAIAPPDFSAAAPPDEEAAFVDAATEQADAAGVVAEASFDVSAEPGAGAVPSLDFDTAAPGGEPAAEPPRPEAVALATDDDIPTIDGEEILEEVPAEEIEEPGAAPAAPLASPPAATVPAPPPEALAPEPLPLLAAESGLWHLPGAHRVVVHTVEGQVKRGVLEDADLDAPILGLAPHPGAPQEDVPSDKVKAIFFMLAPGEKAPAPEGKKVRVTFRDGRQVAGFSPDYRDSGVGFFMVPVDTRTNTGRIWVYRSAVRQVSIS